LTEVMVIVDVCVPHAPLLSQTWIARTQLAATTGPSGVNVYLPVALIEPSHVSTADTTDHVAPEPSGSDMVAL
jgi:hypothetical protein